MAKRLEELGTVDIPLREASGVALRTVDDTRSLVAIGDRTPTLAIAPLEHDGTIGDWTTIDLANRFDWPEREGGSQFEAVAADGAGLVALMREDPPVVHLVELEPPILRATIELVVDRDHPLADRWDDPSSRGEGLVLLRDGRLLVAKEKDRPTLVEFVPPDGESRSIGRADLVGLRDEWPRPDVDVVYRAHNVWSLGKELRKKFEDLSALAATSAGDLLLLSDQDERVGLLRLDVPLPGGGGTIDEFDEVWRLPKVDKPEGLTVIDESQWFVALDTPKAKKNGLVLAAP